MLLRKFKKKKFFYRRIKFVNKFFSTSSRAVSCMKKIFGVSYFVSLSILKSFGFSKDLKLGAISLRNLNKMSDFFINYILVERGLKRYRNNLLLDRRNNGCIRGMRLLNGLPINGQRTHTNSKTVRKLFKSFKFED